MNTNPPPLVFNSAVLVGDDGQIIGTYDKLHRVMFGEYIPFADWLPFLYRVTPLTGGIQAGQQPVILTLGGWRFAPDICYETVMPHVIRRQAATLVDGAQPDVLVNLTNDAWYWGSNELDLHLACGVFRAVETRTPLLIAANGGISAWIGRDGRIRAQSPRQQADVILADVERGAGGSRYVAWGDWFAASCLTACVLVAIIGFVNRRNVNQTRRQADTQTRR
jgi:apolipoprotein N-acyltransferase